MPEQIGIRIPYPQRPKLHEMTSRVDPLMYAMQPGFPSVLIVEDMINKAMWLLESVIRPLKLVPEQNRVVVHKMNDATNPELRIRYNHANPLPADPTTISLYAAKGTLTRLIHSIYQVMGGDMEHLEDLRSLMNDIYKPVSEQLPELMDYVETTPRPEGTSFVDFRQKLFIDGLWYLVSERLNAPSLDFETAAQCVKPIYSFHDLDIDYLKTLELTRYLPDYSVYAYNSRKVTWSDKEMASRNALNALANDGVVFHGRLAKTARVEEAAALFAA